MAVAKVSPDLALVAACCRWPDDQGRRDAIAAATAGVRDWTACLDLAEAHRVVGFVGQGLEAANVAVPEDISRRAAKRRVDVRASAMFQLGETLRISTALRERGVAHRILKGVPLAIIAYGTPTLKQSWDIDILVQPSGAVEAGAVLRGLGFHAVPPARDLDAAEIQRWAVASKDVMLQSPQGTVVELHWRLSDHPGLLSGIGFDKSEREVALIGDRSVPTLSDAENLAYLTVHGAFHGWSRLKWLGDYAAFLQSFDPDVRDTLLECAAALGASRAVGQANLLANRFFGSTFPDAGEPLLQLVDLAAKIIAARTAGEEIESDRAAQFRIRKSQWLLVRGPHYRTGLALGWIRGSEDRKRISLPTRLHWAYWFMRPFTALFRALFGKAGLPGERPPGHN